VKWCKSGCERKRVGSRGRREDMRGGESRRGGERRREERRGEERRREETRRDEFSPLLSFPFLSFPFLWGRSGDWRGRGTHGGEGRAVDAAGRTHRVGRRWTLNHNLLPYDTVNHCSFITLINLIYFEKVQKSKEC